MSSAWERSLRRSDVGPGLAAAAADKKFARPKAGKRKSVAGVGGSAKGTEAHPGVVVTAAPKDSSVNALSRRVSRLSVVNEEEEAAAAVVVDEVFDGKNVGGDVFDGAENKGAKARRPSRSRKSTLGSVGSGTSAFSAGGAAGDAATSNANPRLSKAPSKKDPKIAFLNLLPKTPDLVSPLTPSRVGGNFCLSPLPLPKGVKCIDTEDGSEWSYAQQIVQKARSEDVVYAQSANYTGWKVETYVQRKALKIREQLLDWIIEVLHYFNASQEALYQTVHLIDRYVDSADGKVNNSDVQLIGVAAVLIATKLEEYYPANINELSRLTEKSCSVKQIRKMEQQIMQALNFRSYSLDPMLFLSRFIAAAQREDDPLFKESCQFFVDSMIPNARQWAVKTSAKCAAAVLTSLVLMPNAPNPINAEEELWTPTLQYYTEYKKEYLMPVADQMIQNLYDVKGAKPTTQSKVSGITAKYKSKSKHSGFLDSTPHCSEKNIQRAKLVIQSEMMESADDVSNVLHFDP